jgi:gliding motility-associated lipoprotein GldJ
MKNLLQKILFITITSTLIFGCKNSSQIVSPSTGWKVNDKLGGFYYNTNYKLQVPSPGLVLIEGGTFTRGKIQDDVMHEWVNIPSKQHVQSFYMDETEVTNVMYMEYLYWIKSVFPPENEKYSNIYNGVLPDTLVWRKRLGFNEEMTNNYLRHPAYEEYPVVGVNWIQATEFAKWRTNRVNEYILEDYGFTKPNTRLTLIDAETTFDTETYFAAPSNTYGGNRDLSQGGKISKGMLARGRKKNLYVQRTDGFLVPEYRLPTESEWEYAAAADVGQRLTNNLLGQKRYPWSGNYTRNGKKNFKGDQLANFKQGKGDYGGIAGWSDDGSDITNQVKSYPANEYGLYDMAGNVAEWVADVYRPIVDDEINDFNYYRGNVYKKQKKLKDGTFEVVNAQNLHYDTLRTGKVIATNFPGQIVNIPIDENETYLRQNFDKSYNVNYRDGDIASSKLFKSSNLNNLPDAKILEKQNMYDAPIHNISVDSLGKMLRTYDKSSKRTTLVNDKVRVYKGGSWQDRAYWLDPAQRRYFPEDMATDFIGFRCAMSRIGPKSDFKKVKKGFKISKYSGKIMKAPY